MLTVEQLRNIIKCEVNTYTAVSEISPVKIEETADFDHAINTAASELKDNLTDVEFNKFETLLSQTLQEFYPEEVFFQITQEQAERQETKPYPLWLRILLTELIKDNLINAFIDFYSLTNTLPSVGQVFNIYQYERNIKIIFKDYTPLHDLLAGAHYYLEEFIFEERSCFDDTESGARHGLFNVRFCRYDKGDIVFLR